MTPPTSPADSPAPATTGPWAYAVAATLLLALLAARAYLPRGESRPSELVPAGLDAGSADVAELEQIPGFGPARARAVVTHRAAYGPVTPGESLDRIPGVGPGTAERARPYLIAPPETLTRKPPPAAKPAKIQAGESPIDINTASESELTRLPGVGATLARRLVDARPFTSVDDLRRVKGIGAKTLENVRPYVTK